MTRIYTNECSEHDFRTSGMTCRGSIPFVDFQEDPGTIVLGFFDGSRALAGMGVPAMHESRRAEK